MKKNKFHILNPFVLCTPFYCTNTQFSPRGGRRGRTRVAQPEERVYICNRLPSVTVPLGLLLLSFRNRKLKLLKLSRFIFYPFKVFYTPDLDKTQKKKGLLKFLDQKYLTPFLSTFRSTPVLCVNKTFWGFETVSYTVGDSQSFYTSSIEPETIEGEEVRSLVYLVGYGSWLKSTNKNTVDHLDGLFFWLRNWYSLRVNVSYGVGIPRKHSHTPVKISVTYLPRHRR